MEKNRIGFEYLSRLQAIYHRIDTRGIVVSMSRLSQARTQVQTEIDRQLAIIKGIWKCHVYIGASNDDGTATSVNLNASSGKRTPLLKLKSLGYTIPKVSSRNEDGEYVSKESLAELTLQKILSTNQFNLLGGDPVIKAMLQIRELATLQSRYINAPLINLDGFDSFITNYNVAGTTTGRRASRKHAFGYGNNAQNFPKHGLSAKIYRRCLVARPGKIFLMVDQMQAEDWPVSALAMNTSALTELHTGVDRHKKMACAVFRLGEDHYDAKGWKDSMERFLGKKIRHANNYGMKGNTMSDSLAKEGISMPAAGCQALLDIANMLDPSIKGVFHAYVQKELGDKRLLRTPWGRERQFFGLRSGESSGNQKIYREAYSYIPQSTVGDSTGFAVYDLESESDVRGSKTPPAVIQEGHDSIVQEITDTIDTTWDYIQRTIRAFDREVKFDNGISFTIPVEGELAYDFYDSITLKNYSTGSKKLTDIRYKDLQISYAQLQEMRAKKSGALELTNV